MSRRETSIPPRYFDEMYAAEADPWLFETSAYEREKYDATLAALPRARYARALEVGCSIGVLTERIAARCDALLALDVADAALDRARRRCATAANVDFRRTRVPVEWPAGTFDLILLSEVVYYLDRLDVARLGKRVVASLASNGHVMLVHWLGETDYPLGGVEAAEAFIAATPGLQVERTFATASYRLDLLTPRAR